MNIQIIVKNVGRVFVPHTQSLGKLLKVVEKNYHHPVVFLFEVATLFKVDSSEIIPVAQVEVIVSPVDADGNPCHLLKDFSPRQLEEINEKIQDLLIFSGPDKLNLPASVKIFTRGEPHEFKGTKKVARQEWR